MWSVSMNGGAVAARRTSQVENEQAAAGNGGGGGSSRAAGCTGVGVREGTQTNEVGEGWGWVGGGARWFRWRTGSSTLEASKNKPRGDGRWLCRATGDAWHATNTMARPSRQQLGPAPPALLSHYPPRESPMYSTWGPRIGKDRVLWMHRRVVFRRIRAQIVAIVRVYVALHGGRGGGVQDGNTRR